MKAWILFSLLLSSEGLFAQTHCHSLFTRFQGRATEKTGDSDVHEGSFKFGTFFDKNQNILDKESIGQIAIPGQSGLHAWTQMNTTMHLEKLTVFPGPKKLAEKEILFSQTSASFILQELPKNTALKMLIKTDKGEIFESARIVNHDRTDWVSLRLEEFRPVNNNSSNQESKLLPEDIIKAVGFEIKNLNSKKMILQLPDTFQIGSDLQNHVDVRSFLRLATGYGRIELEGVVNNVFVVDSSGKYLPESKVISVMHKFFNSMKKTENQVYAAATVLTGPRAIEDYLGRRGWSAKHELSEQVRMEDLMRLIASGYLPIESGEFGRIHGKYAHAAQFIAGFKDLNPAETEIVNSYLKLISSHRATENWPLWNPLFDSRGNSVHGNRFWRDLLEKQQSSKRTTQ